MGSQISQYRARMKKSRECGSCSLCCRLLQIKILDKPAGEWCKHCDPGHGCKIHAVKPDICKTYQCQWLLGRGDDEWYPLKSKIIMDFTRVDNNDLVMRFTVDPGFPVAGARNPIIRSSAMQRLKV